jgi:AcrR family transcriptional regulator
MKEPVKAHTPAKPRGRPRSERGRRAILRAARELLDEGGPGAVTMEAVADRAGVGKPTVYRWWPDRHAVAMAALMDTDRASVRVAANPRALTALQKELVRIAERFATPTGRHVATMIAAADRDSELSKSFRNHFVLARRAEGKALLIQAIRQGEIRRGVALEVALDMLYGALFFRLLMGHAPLDAAFARRLLSEVLRGLKSAKSPNAAGTAPLPTKR